MISPDAEVVEQFLKSVQQQDLQGALNCLHSQMAVVEPAGLPYGGTYHGVDGFSTLMQKLTAVAIPYVRGYEVLDGGSLVVGVIQLALTKPNSDSEDLEMPVVELYTVTDGRISRIDVYPKDTKVMADFLRESAGGQSVPSDQAAGRQQSADQE